MSPMHIYTNVYFIITPLKPRGSTRGWQSVFDTENISIEYSTGLNLGSLSQVPTRAATHRWPAISGIWAGDFAVKTYISGKESPDSTGSWCFCSVSPVLFPCWENAGVIHKSISPGPMDTAPACFCRGLTSHYSCRLGHAACSSAGSRRTAPCAWLLLRAAHASLAVVHLESLCSSNVNPYLALQLWMSF